MGSQDNQEALHCSWRGKIRGVIAEGKAAGEASLRTHPLGFYFEWMGATVESEQRGEVLCWVMNIGTRGPAVNMQNLNSVIGKELGKLYPKPVSV